MARPKAKIDFNLVDEYLKAQNGNARYLPYMERLIEVRNILMLNSN